MIRTITEPRVAEIVAAFDHVRDLPDRCDSELCSFMTSVASTVIDRFTIPCVWHAEAIRAVLVAFLLNAPEEDLAEMLESARRELAIHAEVELEGAV